MSDHATKDGNTSNPDETENEEICLDDFSTNQDEEEDVQYIQDDQPLLRTNNNIPDCFDDSGYSGFKMKNYFV
mgnify:CR=1 FL=1